MAEGSWRFVETCSSWPSPLTVIVIVAFKSLGGPDLGLEGKASTPLLHGSLDSFGSSQYLSLWHSGPIFCHHVRYQGLGLACA